VGIACALTLTNGLCTDARLVLGGVGSTPIRCTGVEGALRGQRLTRELAVEAAAVVETEIEPWDDLRGSAAYKQAMARVWTERAIWAIAKSAQIDL
jgi:carbon-monoxide dehydrogenase medium subunit